MIYDDNHVVDHCVFKTPWPLTYRDITSLQTRHNLPDGSFMLVTKSVIWDAAPPTKEFVRGNVIEAGYFVKPINNNKSKLTYVVQVDPKGWVPLWIVKYVFLFIFSFFYSCLKIFLLEKN